MNGQIATAMYSASHFSRLLNSSPNLFSQTYLFRDIIYQAVLMLFRWFNLGNAWMMFKVILELAAQDRSKFDPTIVQGHAGSIPFVLYSCIVIRDVYLTMLCLQLFIAFGGSPLKFRRPLFLLSTAIFVVLQYICVLAFANLGHTFCIVASFCLDLHIHKFNPLNQAASLIC
jgi:hypothetical protein